MDKEKPPSSQDTDTVQRLRELREEVDRLLNDRITPEQAAVPEYRPAAHTPRPQEETSDIPPEMMEAALKMLRERDAAPLQQIEALMRRAADDWQAHQPPARAPEPLIESEPEEDEATLRRRLAEKKYNELRSLLETIACMSFYTVPQDKQAVLVSEMLGAFGSFLRRHGKNSDVMALAMEAELMDLSQFAKSERSRAADTRATSRMGEADTVAPPARLPDVAPELYINRPADPHTGARETAVQFLERVWREPWMANGLLTRAELRKRDPQLMKALERWIDAGNVLPRHLHLPTKQEHVTHQLETADPVQLRETLRLLRAQERRRQRAGD